MHRKYIYRIFLAFCFILGGQYLAGQELVAVHVSTRKKSAYQATLAKNKNVVAFIEYSLVQSGLPKMMRNLSLIESSFDKNTVSSAQAAGIWQFMEEHAADYGLQKEDRFDVYRSTQTAVLSLKNLYRRYGNWITVVAAFNCGEGNIKKAMHKANSNRYELFSIYLPVETRHHVFKFMEACTVTGEYDLLLADYKRWSINQQVQSTLTEVDDEEESLASTAISMTYSLEVIAQEMDLTLADLQQWNPKYGQEILKEEATLLYLPVDKMPDFLLLKNIILNRSLQLSTPDE